MLTTKSITIAVITALSLSCWALWERASAASAKLDTANKAAKQAAADVDLLRQRLEESARATSLLSASLQEAALSAQRRKDAITRTIRNDKPSQDWAGQPVPDAIASMLQHADLSAAEYRQLLPAGDAVPVEGAASAEDQR